MAETYLFIYFNMDYLSLQGISLSLAHSLRFKAWFGAIWLKVRAYERVYVISDVVCSHIVCGSWWWCFFSFMAPGCGGGGYFPKSTSV